MNQYHVFYVCYRCTHCDQMHARLMDDSTPVKEDISPCCGNKALLIEHREIEKPTWDEVKQVYA